MPETQFDKAYYKKFYQSTASRVTDRAEVGRLAAYVSSYLKHIDQPVTGVMDMGCGLGYWKKEIKKHFPGARYKGVEYSEYLCKKYGWEQGSVATYKTDKKFDLVICQGVLQYMDSKTADRAIQNLKRLCKGALFMEILTRKDWEENCEQEQTDGKVYLRSGSWYKNKIKPFKNLGGGVFLSPKSDSVLYEIEYIR